MSLDPFLTNLKDELPKTARQAILSHLTGGHPSTPASSPLRAGVFVTLRDRRGNLRGCVGSVHPTLDSVIAETARSAVLAATQDPRFGPVSKEELETLTIEVSVLGKEERVASTADLCPRRFGVIVRSGPKRGILLPDIDGIDDTETQLAIAKDKAKIGPEEPVEISRFQVHKFREHS